MNSSIHRHLYAATWLGLSGCLVNGDLYRERTDALANTGPDTHTGADTDTATDTGTPTGTGETGAPPDEDGDGFDALVDCDDADDTIHPGACEICGDDIDQDCFPIEPTCHSPLAGVLDLELSAVGYSGVTAGDYAGIAVSGAGDVNGDGLDDLVVGASLANPGGVVKAGSAYLMLAPFTSGTLGAAAARYDGDDADDRAGVAVGSLDFDADGYSDLVIGSKLHSENDPDQGSVYLVYGRSAAPSAFNQLSETGVTLLGDLAAQAGGTLVGAGDLDGLPGDDLLIGGELFDLARGLVYVVPGRTGQIQAGTNQSMSAIGARLGGEAQGDLFGSSLDDGGDVDGDGLHDIVVGALDQPGEALEAGAGYLFYGDPQLTAGVFRSAQDAEYKLLGEVSQDHAGSSISGGDVDGDGYSDVVVGARAHNGDQGAVYLMTSSTLLSVPTSSNVQLSQADAKIVGENPGDRLGQAVSVAGDVNCDGFDDLLMGADRFEGERGAAYLVFGPVDGDISLIDDPAVVKMYGTPESDDNFGAYLSGAGDLDHDGADDVVIGAYKAGESPFAQSGKVWVVFGSQ